MKTRPHPVDAEAPTRERWAPPAFPAEEGEVDLHVDDASPRRAAGSDRSAWKEPRGTGDGRAGGRRRLLALIALACALAVVAGTAGWWAGRAGGGAPPSRPRPDETARTVALFQEGLDLVRKGRWAEARSRFDRAAALAPGRAEIARYAERSAREARYAREADLAEACLEDGALDCAAAALARIDPGSLVQAKRGTALAGALAAARASGMADGQGDDPAALSGGVAEGASAPGGPPLAPHRADVAAAPGGEGPSARARPASRPPTRAAPPRSRKPPPRPRTFGAPDEEAGRSGAAADVAPWPWSPQSDARRRYWAGMRAREAGNLAAAAGYFEEALRLVPADPAATRALAALRQRAGPLFREAYAMRHRDPAAARRKLRLVLRLAREGTDLHAKAQKWLSSLGP